MEIELNGNTYRVEKLTAMEQFHVSRRIAPIVPTIIPIFAGLAGSPEESFLEKLPSMSGAIQSFADGIATMPDEASEYVLSTCLSVVRRKVDQGWAPVWSKSHRVPMFDDIDISILLNLAIRVIKDSLNPFIQGLVSSQKMSPEKAE